MALSPSLDPLIRLRLRLPARRLGERTHDAAAGELDLEIIVTEAARSAQHNVGGTRKALPRRWRAGELRLGCAIAPRLVGNSAEREPRLLDGFALDLEANRDRHQGKRIRQPIADFQIGEIPVKGFWRQLDRT